ncbi:MAG: hypothetical protein NZ846_11510 [Thermus sp.]|uniref:hypothetical protein n=1 Tax=Thermus sp. TaxID=275 RepID=UPI0025E2FF19|nr:hypothetical protein [Thermus sp.]MCS7219572.1 hypothetical protein [Thermus sp.]
MRARGYFFRQGEGGEWLWAPETAEVARVAHALAKTTRGVTFEHALEIMEYAGRLASATRPGTTLPEVLAQLRGLDQVLQRLGELAGHLEKIATRTDSALERGVEGLGRVARQGEYALERAVDQVEERLGGVLEGVEERAWRIAMGWWAAPLVIGVQSGALVALAMRGAEEWLVRLVALVVLVSVFLLGRWSREWL